MAINNSYVRPQSEVHQLLSYTISQTNGHGIACMIGAQYDVFRYGKEEVPTAALVSAGSTFNLPSYLKGDGITTYTIDKESVQLYGVDQLISLGEVSVSYNDAASTVLTADKPFAVDSGDTTSNAVSGYNVQVGDVIYNPTTGIQAKVVKLIQTATDDVNEYSSIEVDKLILIGTSQLGPNTKVKIAKAYEGVIDHTGTPTVGDNNSTITVTPKLGTTVNGVSGTFIEEVGTVYLEYRAAVHIDNDEVIYINSIQDIQDQLGSIDINNELAYACYRALLASGNRTVCAVRVKEDTEAAYLEAIQKTESNAQLYAFTPVTNKQECINTVVDYNNSLSTPEIQKWRITIVGADFDPSKEFKADPEGKQLKATVVSVSEDEKSATLVIDEANSLNGFSFTDYAVKDTIIISNSGSSTTTLTISSVLADNAVKVTGTALEAISTAANISIKRADTAQGNIAFATNLASSLNSRRAVVVWCDNGRADGKVINNAYLAAEIAGLSSAIEPQAGMTRMEITSIDNASRMYTRYTQGQLDRVAAHGVLIVTQDTVDGSPYIRHQLTTSPDKGILYSELSCTRNLDNISYAVSDVIQSFVGRMNVTPSALAEVKRTLNNVWQRFTSNATSPLIGPSLVRYYDASVIQDPAALDRIVVNVTYEIPSPLNRISVYQMTYVARVVIE